MSVDDPAPPVQGEPETEEARRQREDRERQERESGQEQRQDDAADDAKE